MSRADYYSEEGHGPHEYLELGNFTLESGLTLPNAKLAFKTQGTLNEAKDNVILFPHMWSGTSKSMEIFIGKDRPINPDKYFVILPGQYRTPPGTMVSTSTRAMFMSAFDAMPRSGR